MKDMKVYDEHRCFDAPNVRITVPEQGTDWWLMIATPKADVNIIITFCPFCGTRLEPAQR